MHIFYTPNIEISKTLPQDQSKHAIQALRLKAGDIIQSFNGKGKWYQLEITTAHPKKCEVKIIGETFEEENEKKYHIAIAPTKSIDRYEWFLEKATEIGIQIITPIISERSERKVVKRERSERILIAACKQSQKARIPILNEAIALKDFLNKEITEEEKYIAHLPKNRGIKTLKESYRSIQNTLILIGPEGDFSENEVHVAEEKGFVSISLGKSRLRTETAGLTALQTLNILDS